MRSKESSTILDFSPVYPLILPTPLNPQSSKPITPRWAHSKNNIYPLPPSNRGPCRKSAQLQAIGEFLSCVEIMGEVSQSHAPAQVSLSKLCSLHVFQISWSLSCLFNNSIGGGCGHGRVLGFSAEWKTWQPRRWNTGILDFTLLGVWGTLCKALLPGSLLLPAKGKDYSLELWHPFQF